MGRELRAGPGSMRGLVWLARVGPAPLDAWRCAMGWSEVAARSHARRLKREGWLERYPMTRGEGSLFAVTRAGVAMSGVPVRAACPPAPTWWAHLCGCAWAASWLTGRGRVIQGCREVIADPAWSGMVRWADHKGMHKARHRPDLAWVIKGTRVPIEVELAQKSEARLKAILELHADWYAARAIGGLIYICGDSEGAERIQRTAERVGLRPDGGGLRIELLTTIKEQSLAGCESQRAGPTAPAMALARAESDGG